MARLLSLNVGMPTDLPWQGRTVHTGIVKDPVDGPRMVRRLNIDGDGQGDLNGHGGEIRAVLVYQRESYEYWRDHLGRDDLSYGRFGENFTVEGLPDDEVCVGDRYRIGEAEFEVTQPRVTCFRLGMRLNEPRMPALLVAHRRPGFYFRVITEGHVQAGDEITRTCWGRHHMSVAAIDALLYLPDRDIGRLHKAVDLPALSPGWQTSFRELLTAAEHPSAAAVPPPGTEPIGWAGFRPLRVSRIEPESPTVVSIRLRTFDGAPLSQPEPGQYLTLRLGAAGDPAPVRNYSLSGAPRHDEYRIGVKHEPHGVVSGFLHSRLRVGDSVEVAAPRGDFVLDEHDSTPVLLLSAGVGVTPVLAMLHALAASHSDREICWVHTTRNAAQHAYAAEVHDLLTHLPRGRAQIHYTAPDPGDIGAVRGRPTRETLAALNLPPTTTAYLCGPATFMADMRAALFDIGLADDHIHTELFGARAAINPGLTDATTRQPHQPPGKQGTGPRITFARSGLTVAWTEKYASVLELAEACDVPTRWSCRTGVCHTCQTPLLSGTADQHPDPLEPAEPGTTLLCCAQPETDLVLDL